MPLIAAKPVELDLPLPQKFSLVETASEDHTAAGGRVFLQHLYEGAADKNAVREFYRAQMTLSRWSLVSDSNIKGDITMRFEKGDETCTLGIGDAKGWWAPKTRVQVVIARNERGPTPPPGRKEP